MTSEQRKDIKPWIEVSRYDLDTAKAMLRSRRYLYVLFICQQSLEKLFKAYVTAKTGEFPPRIHNLVRLGELAGNIPSEADGGHVDKTATAIHTEELIKRAIDYLRQRVRLEQAVLFGSYARGDADAWSDVDLAVISSDFARMSRPKLMELLVQTSLAVNPKIELWPYTPKDLKEARPTNFLGHILAEGKVVYQQGKFLL